MTRKAIIEKTLKAINQLPDEKVEEISDFAEFISKRYEESRLSEAIKTMAASSEVFSFLKDEEDLYNETDLKEVYHD